MTSPGESRRSRAGCSIGLLFRCLTTAGVLSTVFVPMMSLPTNLIYFMSLLGSQYLTATHMPRPFSLSPCHSPFCTHSSCEISVTADAFPLSALLSDDSNPGTSWLGDETDTQRKRDYTSLSPSFFSSSSSSSCLSHSSLSPLPLSFPRGASPYPSALQALPCLPNVTSITRNADPTLLASTVPASLPNSVPRSSPESPPMWQCSLGCGQKYERSSGRSIRKHFATCFRRHWPGGELLTETALEALISSQQENGLLVTGFRAWKMRCKSVVKPMPRREKRRLLARAAGERVINNDNNTDQDDGSSQDQNVKMRQEAPSTTAISDSSSSWGCSSDGVLAFSSHREFEAHQRPPQALSCDEQQQSPLEALRSTVEQHGLSEAIFDGFAPSTPVDFHGDCLFSPTERRPPADGCQEDGLDGENKSVQQVIISRIQRERRSLFLSQNERREFQESEHLRERQRQENNHMRMLLSTMYTEHFDKTSNREMAGGGRQDTSDKQGQEPEHPSR